MSSLATLPTTRRALLTLLKREGRSSADELAGKLAITVSAVRQHLTGLLADGLVAFEEERSGPGRPRHRYHLTAEADDLFPRTYSELTNELLEYVEDEDPEMLERVFERRRQRRVDRATVRLARRRSFAGKIEELVSILDEDGYLAEVVTLPSGVFRIVEHNCAILAVAMRYGTACGSELSFIREVLPEATVERVAHMMAGAHVCAYEVTPLKASA